MMCAHPDSLVSTQWVADHLNDPGVRIVEVIWESQAAYGIQAYAAGHIPGAVAWDYEVDYGEAKGDIIDRSSFEKRPTEQTIPTYPPTQYKAMEPEQSLRASRADVMQAIGKESVLLVDARSAEMFRGESHPGTQSGGHVPGAINLAARREVEADGSFKAWRVPTVGSDGIFKTKSELKALFEDLAITTDKEIVTYCLRGGLSNHAWFVLTQLLGYPNVREYDRSWAEWGNLPDAPVEIGS